MNHLIEESWGIPTNIYMILMKCKLMVDSFKTTKVLFRIKIDNISITFYVEFLIKDINPCTWTKSIKLKQIKHSKPNPVSEHDQN